MRLARVIVQGCSRVRGSGQGSRAGPSLAFDARADGCVPDALPLSLSIIGACITYAHSVLCMEHKNGRQQVIMISGIGNIGLAHAYKQDFSLPPLMSINMFFADEGCRLIASASSYVINRKHESCVCLSVRTINFRPWGWAEAFCFADFDHVESKYDYNFL